MSVSGIQAYRPSTSYKHISYSKAPIAPECAKNTTKAWCIEDSSYPLREVQQALEYHRKKVYTLYKDVVVNTGLSVDGLNGLTDETYLCPSVSEYIQPLRALSVEGKWRVIVNRLESYGVKFTQSVRVEECEDKVGTACPLVPDCYASKCVQQQAFHRFLVYDPYDHDLPFAIEKFKMPSSCACAVGAFFPDN